MTKIVDIGDAKAILKWRATHHKPKHTAEPPKLLKKSVITIGTDFSGLETPSIAMELNNIPYKLAFVCDHQAHLRAFIQAKYSPDLVMDDIRFRDAKQMPSVDVYILGPPCQPWSGAGQQLGLDDPQGRGDLWFECSSYIQEKHPKVIVLENVAALMERFEQEFTALIDFLKDSGYAVYHQVVDTSHHGLPQHRQRAYVVAILKKIQTAEFTFPKQLPWHHSLTSLLDRTTGHGDPPTSNTSRINIANALREAEQEHNRASTYRNTTRYTQTHATFMNKCMHPHEHHMTQIDPHTHTHTHFTLMFRGNCWKHCWAHDWSYIQHSELVYDCVAPWVMAATSWIMASS
jgi:DNA-cytosine methyltransferase